MDTKTELLLDYQEMAILALREEVERLTTENEFLTYRLTGNDLRFLKNKEL
jgi:hypothetical protein